MEFLSYVKDQNHGVSFVFFWDTHLAVYKVSSWFCAQRPYVVPDIKLRLVVCKAGILRSILFVAPAMKHISYLFSSLYFLLTSTYLTHFEQIFVLYGVR